MHQTYFLNTGKRTQEVKPPENSVLSLIPGGDGSFSTKAKHGRSIALGEKIASFGKRDTGAKVTNPQTVLVTSRGEDVGLAIMVRGWNS